MFRFGHLEFHEREDGDAFKMEIIDDETCLLRIHDTAAEVEYPAMRDNEMRHGQGFVCLYAINSRSSFDEITSFRERILWVKDEDKVPMVLVGNKCDLEEERQVTTVEGQDLAKSFDCPFYETSTRKCVNIQEAFYELVREIQKVNQSENAGPVEVTKKGGHCTLF